MGQDGSPVEAQPILIKCFAESSRPMPTEIERVQIAMKPAESIRANTNRGKLKQQSLVPNFIECLLEI